MNLPPIVIVVALVLIGFLTGSTAYFYNQTRSHITKPTGVTFDGTVPPQPSSANNDAVDSNTKPAEPKGRLSYPANVYTVQPKETLFAVGTKVKVPWQIIQSANGFTDENVIQSGSLLVIPKYYPNTDNYRINFIINDDKAVEILRQLKGKDTDDQFDPVKVSKASAPPYFGITTNDTFNLVEADLHAGTAVVDVKNTDHSFVIGLVQPKTKGDKGFWAILYIEKES